MVWKLLGGFAAGATYLAGRSVVRRSHRDAAARAAGLGTASDLTHLPEALQRTALWALADGGFETRIVHGALARTGGDVELTAFDLETLRERRGEWAYLPVERPFRIGGHVSVAICVIDRRFPHMLFKRAGHGDQLAESSLLERVGNIAAQVRDRFGVPRRYASELPKTLPTEEHRGALPLQWRAYSRAPELVDSLVAGGLGDVLAASTRRDLVIELLDGLVVVYPAAKDAAGADAFADLTTMALAIVDGVLAASPRVTPRGMGPTST